MSQKRKLLRRVFDPHPADVAQARARDGFRQLCDAYGGNIILLKLDNLETAWKDIISDALQDS